MSVTHKQCPSCGETKPAADFAANKAKKDGLASQCRTCKALLQKRWYAQNKERHLLNVKARTRQQREALGRQLLLYFKEHPCVDCGEDDPVVLDFDHIKGSKRANVSALLHVTGASWETLLTEIAKCVVRCANCHRKKTAKEQNTLRFRLTRNLEP